MTAPELTAFHIALVVRDLDEAMARYRKVLGVELWHEWQRPGASSRVAFGAGAGATFELISMLGEGDSQFHQFAREHGGGVQHIGFWCPDVGAAVKCAVEEGGRVVSGALDAEGNAVVQVTPANVDALHYRYPVFVNAGVGFTLEYFGPGGEQLHKDMFKDDYARMVKPPPWE